MSSPISLTNATFDNAAPRFGGAALSGGYGVMGYSGASAFFAFGVTLECWMRGLVAPSAQKVALGCQGFAWLGCDAAGNACFSYTDASGATVVVGTSSHIWDGAWHHIVGQANNLGAAVYVDGVMLGSSSVAYGIGSANSAFAVGDLGGSVGGSNGWTGEIDEAAFFVNAKYSGPSFSVPTAPYSGNESGLFALYHLDGNGNDSLAMPAAIAPPIVVGSSAGGVSLIEGQFFKGMPAGLTYALDGAAGVVVPSASIVSQGGGGSTQFGLYSFSIATPAAGSHNLVVSATGTYASTAAAVGFVTTAAAQPGMTAPNVSGLLAGGMTVVTSSFSGGAPSGVAYVLDGGTAMAVASPTIVVTSGAGSAAAGTASCSFSTPFAGAHSIVLQGTGVYASTSPPTGFVTTSSADVLSAPVIAGLSASGVMSFTGTFLNGAPTSISYTLDGGGPVSAPTALIQTVSGAGATAAGTYQFVIPSFAYGAHTVSVSGQGPFASTSAPTSFVLAAPNDPGLVYSPYNWLVTHSSAQTVNSGAYVKSLFAGDNATLLFDVSQQSAVPSRVAWRVDDSPRVRAPVSALMPLAPFGDMVSPAHHYLEMVVSGATDPAFGSVSVDRWGGGIPNTKTVLTGVVLPPGGALSPPQSKTGRLLVFGDSITEGLHTLYPNASAVDADSHAAEYGWAFLLGDLLDCEVGVVGFGGQGLGISGDGNVPAFPATYQYLFSGVSRAFSPAPNLIVINHGTNDAVHGVSASATIAAMTGVLNGLLAAATAPIVVLQPFGAAYASNQTANLQAAIAGCSAPGRVSFIGTQSPAPWMVATDMADSWHPNAVANMSRIAPLCAAALRGIAWPGGGAAAGPLMVLVS